MAHTAVKPLKHGRDPQGRLTVNSLRPASDEGVLSGGRAILPLKSYVNININVTQQPLRQSSPGENGLGRAQCPAPYLLTPQPWVRLLLWPWCSLSLMAVKGCLSVLGCGEGSVTSAARELKTAPGTQQVLNKCTSTACGLLPVHQLSDIHAGLHASYTWMEKQRFRTSTRDLGCC